MRAEEKQIDDMAFWIALAYQYEGDEITLQEMFAEIAKRKIEEAMKANGYDDPSQMPVKEVLDHLDRGGE